MTFAFSHFGALAARSGDVVAKHLRPLDPASAEALARTSLVARIEREVAMPFCAPRCATLCAVSAAAPFADDDDSELAAGLAYWRHAFLDLGERTVDVRPFDPDATLPRVSTTVRSSRTAWPRSRANRHSPRSSMVHAFARAIFRESRRLWYVDSPRRVLLPYANDPDAFVDYLWRAIVAAYTSAGLPGIPTETYLEQRYGTPPTWAALINVVCASDDEHIVKAAFTARQEHDAYANPIYRLAVARYIGS